MTQNKHRHPKMSKSRIRLLVVIGHICLSVTFVRVEALNSYDPRATLPSRIERSKHLSTLHGTTFDDVDDETDLVTDFEDGDDTVNSLMASPLSQIPSRNEDEWFSGGFSRRENWLEDATAEILDLETVPLGSLTADDVVSITGLMAAWVRRRSLEAALTVERLLKRVIDDLRAENAEIHATLRMYTIAIDAWGKSGEELGAQRAQHIHDGINEMYKQSGNAEISPTTVSYNTVMNAWGKSPQVSAPEMAEALLHDMIEWDSDATKPDVLTFSILLDTYARSSHPHRVRRAEELFDNMKDLRIQRNVYTYSAFQNVYARSGKSDAPELCLQVLERMLDLYSNGDMFAKPNCVNYNAVLGAYSRTNTKQSAERANAFLTKMEQPKSEGGYDIEPDRFSYAMTILACARCPDASFGSALAEANLDRMEERALTEAKKRAEISSAAPSSVTLDFESFNVVLMAISRSRQQGAVLRAVNIVKRMENYAEEGQVKMIPNVRSWNAILNSLSRSGEKDAAERAEKTLNHMFELHKTGAKGVKPDAFSFSAVLSAYQRLGTQAAIQRADDIVRHMEELYENGGLEDHPDCYHYTILCAAWSKSKQKRRASIRAVEILSIMKAKHRAGYFETKPNTRAYNSVLDTLCRAGDTEKAEQLLYHMLALVRDGDMDALPDSFSFNCVISSFTRSNRRDAGTRAESLLDRFFEFSEEFPNIHPDTQSFTHIIAHYGRNKQMMDAPYRAEYVLNRLISAFRSGSDYLAPNVFAFTTVMDCYAQHKHPDAGDCAERLVRTIQKLKRQHTLDELEVNTGVMNSVMNAWAWSGHGDAGTRAEAIVNEMETKSDVEGHRDLRPNIRTYNLLINAWSKSNATDKAQRALEVLNRMKKRHASGKLLMRPNEYTHSLVINACAYTTASPEVEECAFKIAVQIMTEMIESEEMAPTRSSFGWFLQACGRLHVPRVIKDENIERAFSKCQEMGLVNEFVFHHFKGASSDSLFERIMTVPISKIDQADESCHNVKEQLEMSHLPTTWTQEKGERKNDSTKSSMRRPDPATRGKRQGQGRPFGKNKRYR